MIQATKGDNSLRMVLQQRVLPDYRSEFVDTLAQACGGGLGVICGLALEKEAITTTVYMLVNANWMPTDNRHFMDPSSPLFLFIQPGFVNWLKYYQPQVLVVEANPRYLSTPGAIRWMHAHRRPVLGWGLGAPPLSGRVAGLRDWERKRFLGMLDGVIAYSEKGAGEYRALGMPAERVFVAHNAVMHKPKMLPPLRPAGYGGQPVVLFVGRLQARKRIDLLLKACAQLPDALRPRLVIVGDGPDRAQMEAEAKDFYPSAVFAGARHGAELVRLFSGADLFVLPGTGGLAVQQAMTYGLPVIVARGDGTQEDLVRPENGWLTPPDDPQALQNTLLEALSDPKRLRQKGLASYRIVAEEVNLEQMVAVFVRAAETVLTLGVRK